MTIYKKKLFERSERAKLQYKSKTRFTIAVMKHSNKDLVDLTFSNDFVKSHQTSDTSTPLLLHYNINSFKKHRPQLKKILDAEKLLIILLNEHL